MPLPQTEHDAVIERYSRRFEEYGYDPKTLGWAVCIASHLWLDKIQCHEAKVRTEAALKALVQN